jgi:hypothetical protein
MNRWILPLLCDARFWPVAALRRPEAAGGAAAAGAAAAAAAAEAAAAVAAVGAAAAGEAPWIHPE